MKGKVYIVHTIDTEGPLYESIENKFERLKEVFGIGNISATISNFRKLENGELSTNVDKSLLKNFFSSNKHSTLGDWRSIHKMLNVVCSNKFRRMLLDCNNEGWVFNWYCMDHIDYKTNLRKRDIGFHNIHDEYQKIVDSQPDAKDSIQFHFHPMSTYNDAHRCGTHYLRTDHLYQILCRRIIDRSFFPSSYRAGFQAERPDSHWFLEQFIPFDMTNMSTEDTSDIDNSSDFKMGRSGNWRLAPNDWSVYRPSHENYQVPGECKRLIGRSLNIRGRVARLTQDELNKAFSRAESGLDTIVGICSHDWRDLEVEVNDFREMLKCSSALFPGVDFSFSDAKSAFFTQLTKEEKAQEPIKLSLEFSLEDSGDCIPFITVKTEFGKIFGSQPFLAIKTKSNRYIHDNFDFSVHEGVWHYAFHSDTLPISDVDKIGVAANDIQGNTCVLSYVVD